MTGFATSTSVRNLLIDRKKYSALVWPYDLNVRPTKRILAWKPQAPALQTVPERDQLNR